MRYLAVLQGQPNVLEWVAQCFVGERLRIRKLGKQWVLESQEFDSCKEPPDVFPIADALVSRIHQILALYCHLHTPLWVQGVQGFDAEGRPFKSSIRATTSVEVCSSKGIAELSDLKANRSFGDEILELAESDPAVMEALNLRGEKPVGWSHVYDVIEFCGGVEGARKLSSVSRKRVREIKQTANHYRHLGSPKNYPLPTAPPSSDEASTFARDLLKKWISCVLPRAVHHMNLSNYLHQLHGQVN